MAPYCYSPLPTPTSIRVLRLPNIDPVTGIISTSFRIIDLAHITSINRPLYHTLSYTWGNPHADGPFFADNYTSQAPRYSTQDSILVDGYTLTVNRNLHDALLSMKPDSWRRFCDARTKRMRSQLHLAVLLRKVQDVHALVKSNVKLDLVNDETGWTPLMYAAAMGEEEIVRVLLAAGANVDIMDKKGVTAEEAARRNGQEEIVGWVKDAAKMDLEKRRKRFGCSKGTGTGLDDDGPDLWIWIDQLCINQADLKERGNQVNMMGEIYSGAFWTLVWLGAEDCRTATALQAINKLADAEGDLIKSDILPYMEQPEELYVAANIPYISPAEWTALASLFQRQYFRRVWVIQENLVSRTTLGLCGNVELPWRQLCTVAQQLYIRQLVIGRPTSAKYIDTSEAALQVEHRASQLVQWTDRWLNGQQAMNPKACNLGTLVGDCWTFHATDARDKIFGFYGLFNLLEKNIERKKRKEKKDMREPDKIGSSEDTPRKSWIADYSKSAAQVFAEATKTMIGETEDLAVLANVIDISLRQTADLPSWSPDFSVPFSNALPSQYNGSVKNYAPSITPSISNPIPWSHLPVQVWPLDTILQTGPTTCGPGETTVYFSRSWISLALLLPTPYQETGLSRTEVLWRTLIADTALAGTRPAPAAYGPAFRDLVATMLCIAAREEAQRFSVLNIKEGKVLRLPECPAPSLEVAVEHVKTTWQNPVLQSLGREELMREFGEVGSNLSGEKWEALVFGLMGLHVLALTELERGWKGKIEIGQSQNGNKRVSELFTPTLDQLLDFEKRMDWSGGDQESGSGVKLLPANTDLLHVLRQRLGRRRLFVTESRFLGIGPAGMREGDRVVLIRGFGSLAIVRKREEENSQGKGEGCEKRKGEQGLNDDRVEKQDKHRDADGVEERKEWQFIGQAFVFGVKDGKDECQEKGWEEINLV